MKQSALITPSQPPRASGGGEEQLTLHRVPWYVYVSLRDALDESNAHVKLTYLRGELELMSPSSDHEEVKSLLGRLLEAWCLDNGVELFLHGSTTLRDEKVERGLEADESYSVGTRKAVPDIAIEVVYTWWRVDKLETYRGLGVPEVWVFRDGQIQVHVLESDGYQPRERSHLLPDLDLGRLASHAVPGTSLTEAVRRFRSAT